jgi:hypothetical protein
MSLRRGDIVEDKLGDWRVIGHPYSSAGGKTVNVRIEAVKQPDAMQIRAWAAHERITVKRAGGRRETHAGLQGLACWRNDAQNRRPVDTLRIEKYEPGKASRAFSPRVLLFTTRARSEGKVLLLAKRHAERWSRGGPREGLMATSRWEDHIHFYDYDSIERRPGQDAYTVAEAFIYNPDETASLALVFIVTGQDLRAAGVTPERAITEARRNLEQLTRPGPGTFVEQAKMLKQDEVLLFSWNGLALGQAR